MNIVCNSVWLSTGGPGLPAGKYRILLTNGHADTLVLLSLTDARSVKPFEFGLDDFKRGISAGVYSLSEYELPGYMLQSEADINPASLEMRDRNFSLIQPLISDSIFLTAYSNRQRSPLLKEYAEKSNHNVTTLRVLLTLYWRYGMSKQALLPAYSMCGAAGGIREPGVVPLGRKKRSRVLLNSRSETYIIRAEDRQCIRQILQKYYLKAGGENLSRCYKHYLSTFFSSEIAEGQRLNKSISKPSITQFRYWAKRLIDKDEVLKKKLTPRQYAQRARGLLGAAATPTVLAGDVFEIDATVADVHIISQYSSDLVGRPTIYVVRDRATRMVVGLHVSHLYASWDAGRQALANCFMPKKEFCWQFGIELGDGDWPCNHVPLRLMCDNGEMAGQKSQLAVIPLMRIELPPSYRPDRKGVVERCFGILNDEALHQLSGTTRGARVIPGEEDPRSRACYTLKEITTRLIEAVLDHNRSLNEELGFINPLLLEHGLHFTPLNSWRISMEAIRFSGRSYPTQFIVAHFLRADTASITEYGIVYRNRVYACSETQAAIARNFGRTKCEIRIDETTMNYIYVRYDGKSVFTRHNLLDRRKIFRDAPHMEGDIVADIFQIQKEIMPITSEYIDMNKRNEDREEIAVARLKDNMKSTASRANDMRANRRNEIEKNLSGELEDGPFKEYINLAENIALLPGREERAEWLARKKNKPDGGRE